MDSTRLRAQIPGLRRYARALTGNTWVADDLVQDTLERACSRWRLWTPDSDLRAWLFTIMHNLYANDVRRLARERQSGIPVDPDDVHNELVAAGSGQELSIDLQRCLMHLPEDQRTVLLLASIEDLTYAEIARVTSTPVGTVMSRLSRARARLQSLMDAPAIAEVPHTNSSATIVPLRRRGLINENYGG